VLSRKNPPLHARDAPLQQILWESRPIGPAANKRSRENNQVAGSVLATDHRTALGMRPSPLHGKARLSRTGQRQYHRRQRSKKTRTSHEHLPPRQQTGTRRRTRQGSFRICSSRQRKSPLCDPNGAQPKSAGLCMDRSQPIALIRRNCVAVVEDQKQIIRSNFAA
jgi:hypothetical protein